MVRIESGIESERGISDTRGYNRLAVEEKLAELRLQRSPARSENTYGLAHRARNIGRRALLYAGLTAVAAGLAVAAKTVISGNTLNCEEPAIPVSDKEMEKGGLGIAADIPGTEGENLNRVTLSVDGEEVSAGNAFLIKGSVVLKPASCN